MAEATIFAGKNMTLPSPVQAVIFDMDGTLVNTEPVHCEAWLEVLAARGYQYDEEWFEQWIGTSDRLLAEGVIAEHGLTIEPRVLQLEKQDVFYQEVVRKAVLFEGVVNTLDALKGKLPLAIATNSSRQDADHVFIPTKLDQWMNTVVTATDVNRLKPAPDMYLLAAERLGVAPANCLVVEDSPAGAQGALEAGMYVLGLTSSQPAEKMPAVQELHPFPGAAMERILQIVG